MVVSDALSGSGLPPPGRGVGSSPGALLSRRAHFQTASFAIRTLSLGVHFGQNLLVKTL